MSLQCDFCSAEHPTWAYPCQDFDEALPGARSHGAWCACDRCAEYIEKRAYNALVDRVIATLPGAQYDAFIIALLTVTYEQFDLNRTGPRRPARLEVN